MVSTTVNNFHLNALSKKESYTKMLSARVRVGVGVRVRVRIIKKR